MATTDTPPSVSAKMIACLTFSEAIDLATLVAAVVGLIFVWWQIRQVKEQLFLQHFADYTKRYQEIILQFPESINEPSFDVALPEHRDKVMRQMRAYTDLCFEEWFLNQNFRLHPKIWQTWDAGMTTAFSKRAFRDGWSAIKKDTAYCSAFQSHIDEKVSAEKKSG